MRLLGFGADRAEGTLAPIIGSMYVRAHFDSDIWLEAQERLLHLKNSINHLTGALLINFVFFAELSRAVAEGDEQDHLRDRLVGFEDQNPSQGNTITEHVGYDPKAGPFNRRRYGRRNLWPATRTRSLTGWRSRERWDRWRGPPHWSVRRCVEATLRS